MKLLFVFLALAFFSHYQSIEIDCEYDANVSCDLCSGLYFCKVRNSPFIISQIIRDITGIKGQHVVGNYHNNVKGFEVYGKLTTFFPRGIVKFFKNLEYIHIQDGGLQQLTKEDLKEFSGNLKYLSMSYNKLEVLEADLFVFNKNLIYIDLSWSKIKFISDKAFAGLDKLSTIYLSGNPCISGTDSVRDNHQIVLQILSDNQPKCKDYKTVFSRNPAEFFNAKFLQIETKILTEISNVEKRIKTEMVSKFNDQKDNFNNCNALNVEEEFQAKIGEIGRQTSELRNLILEQCDFLPFNAKLTDLKSGLEAKFEHFCKKEEYETSA